MSTLGIIALVVFIVLALLAVGGAIAQRRRMAATEALFHARVEQANHDLAEAHAADNGWEPERVEAAARRAFAERHPGVEIASVSLVQVIDPPGTEDDKAVFRVEAGGEVHDMTLGRRGDDWIAE
ncbi:MAG TPA: hypothetical protein VM266_00895 [Solirubrobacteraceae bacterium]|nr:hypothetical protein [Solirubrobacteraceae bacterium]